MQDLRDRTNQAQTLKLEQDSIIAADKKAVKDSAGLDGYYEANKKNYMWGERADAIIYTCGNAEVAKSVEKLIQKKAKKGYSNEDILKMINTDSQLNLKIEEGVEQEPIAVNQSRTRK